MRDKAERWSVWAGVAAVVLWVIGVFVIESASIPSEDATDADYLAYYRDNANGILAGNRIFVADITYASDRRRVGGPVDLLP